MAFNLKEIEHFNSAQIRFGSTGATFNGASHEYMNIPKARFSFVVHFELSDVAKQMIQRMYGISLSLGDLTAYVIKDTDKPSFSLETTEMNQYNRTRLHQGKIKYSPVTMTIYDTVSSYGTMLIDAYSRYHYGDFSDKTFNSWNYDIVSSKKNFEQSFSLSNFIASAVGISGIIDTDYTWGRSVYNQGDQNLGYFFKRIDLYEIDGNSYTVYNLHNPVIESVKYDNKSHEGGEAAQLTLSWKYEGITNICPITAQKAISAPTAQIAARLSSYGDGEWAAFGFFKYWGEMDDAPLSSYDPNQIAGFPSSNSDPTTTGSSGSSIIDIATSAASVYDALTGGSSILDVVSNTTNALGSGNTGSTANSVISSALGSISKIGGLF